MITKKNPLSLLSIVILFLINSFFLYKYANIYFNASIYIIAVYASVFAATVFIFTNPNVKDYPHKYLKFVYAVLIVASFCYVIFVKQIGEIGRLIAIKDWIDLFFAGSFPYYSFHTPSAFPVLFYISMPFYFIGNIGLLVPLGLSMLFYISYKTAPDIKTKYFHIALVVLSVVIAYDFVVRSELIFNILLPVFLYIIAKKYLNPAKINIQFILFAVLFGLAFSTRSVLAVVYAVIFINLFKHNLKNLIVFGTIIVAVFIATLLPIYLWDPHGFLTKGPFAVQSFLAFLPVYVIGICIAASFVLGYVAKNDRQIFFYSGFILFLLVFISMMIKIFIFGVYESMINDLFDLSYYSFAAPLLILAAGDNKNGKS